VFYFSRCIGADVSAHRDFLSWSDQCHLLSIFCTFVIEQINDDDDDDDCRPGEVSPHSFYGLRYTLRQPMITASKFSWFSTRDSYFCETATQTDAN